MTNTTDMKRIGSMDTVADEFIWKGAFGLISKELGKSVGSEQLYANLDIVPPGAHSTKYHSHSRQEEFFFILSGNGTLRLNDKELQVGTGDFFAKPAGKGITHTFYNSSSQNLLILDVGTRPEEDTCYYPDEDMYLHRMNGIRQKYSGKTLDDDWSANPDT